MRFRVRRPSTLPSSTTWSWRPPLPVQAQEVENWITAPQKRKRRTSRSGAPSVDARRDSERDAQRILVVDASPVPDANLNVARLERPEPRHAVIGVIVVHAEQEIGRASCRERV